MPGLSRFSHDELLRIKRMHYVEKLSSVKIAEIINFDRRANRLCTSRGVRSCLKRLSIPVNRRRVYKRKLNLASQTLLRYVGKKLSAISSILTVSVTLSKLMLNCVLHTYVSSILVAIEAFYNACMLMTHAVRRPSLKQMCQMSVISLIDTHASVKAQT